MNEDEVTTKFKAFDRYGDFFAFGDLQTSSVGRVNVLAGGKLITLTTNQADIVSYGKHVWISNDKNTGVEENIIVAITKLTSENPIQGKIEF